MTRKVAVVTDSTADLPAELTARRAVTVVPLTVILNGRELLDGVEITAAEFYRRFAEPEATASTSQPSPGRFADTYRRLLEEHDEVVSIHISSKLSGTHASARQGADLVDSGRVTLIDSEVVSMPLGLLVLAAAEKAAQGASAAEVAALVEALKNRVRVFFSVGSLEYLRRGGRIGRASALVGSILRVKPVLTIEAGEVTPLERVRTTERALGRVIELAREVDSGQGICAIVGHASAEDAAARIASTLDSVAETILIQPLGPVVGTHAGPGTVGIGCYPAELFPLRLTATAGLARAR